MLSDSALLQTAEIVAKHGVKGAMEQLSLSQRAVYARLEKAQYVQNGNADDDDDTTENEPIDPIREKHDSSFWRSKSRALEDEVTRANLIADQILAFNRKEIRIPRWASETSAMPERGAGPPLPTKRHKSILGLLVSDTHTGEVVKGDAVNGLNSYDINTFKLRFRQLFSAAAEIGSRWLIDREIEGAAVFFNGDLVSGSIHAELRETNEVISFAQVEIFVEEACAALLFLADRFGKVLVFGTAGNHGRSTDKPYSKLYAQLSFDTLALIRIKDRLAHDSRFTFNIASGRDLLVDLLGFRWFVTHGDSGSQGGQGFAGPVLPIARKARQIQLQCFTGKNAFDYLLTSHHHFSSNPTSWHLANGSLVGYTEYAHTLRTTMEPPQQWVFVIDEVWGMRERLPVRLDV
jgi:hypothetical protein